jgi:hypothetical protein
MVERVAPVGREIDFVVLRNGKPEFAVECKTGAGRLTAARPSVRSPASS